MSKSDFEQLLYKRYRFNIWFGNLLAIALLAGALYFIYKLIIDWNISDQTGRYFNLLLPTFLIGTGIWAIKKNRDNYKITSLKAKNEPLDRNYIINNLSNNLKLTIIQSEVDPAMLLARGFWRAGYEIFVAFDNDMIHFDVQHYSLGVIDFGVRRRICKKIINELRPAYNMVYVSCASLRI